MTDTRRKQQWKALALGGTALVGVFAILGWLMNQNQANLVGSSVTQTVDPTIISDAASTASPELSWIAQSRQEIERLTQQVTELNQTVVAGRAESEQRIAALQAMYDEAILTQQQEINTLKGGGADPNAPLVDANGAPLAGGDFVSPSGGTAPATPGMPSPGAQPSQTGGFGSTFTLAAAPGGEAGAAQAGGTAVAGSVPPGPGGSPEDGYTTYDESHVRKLGSYVPAGSYAPATVIAGVDASTGVKSQENPVPVLLRLNGPATTAALGSGPGAKINLTGCTVLGSAVADLSAERVYVRLTSMTCVNGRGEVLEVPVAGIVVGAGKAGVRGTVVSREGGLVRNAAIAGVLQGIGQMASKTSGDVAGADNLDGTVSSITGASAAGALGDGLTGAANSLAEYYIERAEQYQPVVSLYSGTEVEVVFIDGVDLR